jgi:glycosyltransferase involved in cell wall biosynthesis
VNASVCITILNEEGAISRLLDSLLVQTKKPGEIILVDGGSTDRTVEIIKHYQKKNREIKLIVDKGTIAHGRNVAAELAQFPIIAQIDVGCVAKRDWLEKITNPFKEENVDMVAGFYKMVASSPMQEAMNVYHGIPPERFNPLTFLPSARSVAFRKTLWEEIGGYSEKLSRAGEDTLFFYKAVKNKSRIVRVEEAIVVWEETGTFSLKNSLRKFYFYAKGDAQIGIWWHRSKQLSSHNIKISLIYLRYAVGLFIFTLTLFGHITPLFLLFLIIFYLIYPIWKWRDVVKSLEARVFLPIVQISSDFAVMAGFLTGVLGR